jgi:hypothetical protein
MASPADGRAEREVASVPLYERGKRRGWLRRTVGADKGNDTRGFRRRSARPRDDAGRDAESRPRRRERHRSTDDAPSRLRDESARSTADRTGLGWLKSIAWLRKIKLRGLSNVHWLVCFAAAAFNLRRLTTLNAMSA